LKHCILNFLSKIDFHRESDSHPFSVLPPPPHPTFNLYAAIDAALEEDAGDFGDITTLSTVPDTTTASATFLAKAEGVLAGAYVAHMVFKRVDPAVQVTWLVDDSSTVTPGQILATATGSARSILIAERVALNFMQRMSGVATMTAAMVKAVRCTRTTILDTRKTVPGLRLLDKWAVAIGGGANHRIGLYDMVMIKDNHIAAAGGIKAAVDGAAAFMQSKGIQRPMEVETRTIDELKEVLSIWDDANVSSTGGHYDSNGITNSSGITRIMLDNMTRKDTGAPSGIDVSTLHEAMALIGDRKIETEASGNVTLATVEEIAKTGVEFISCGALTHSVTALDISLNIETQ
jgi:nicotinate-nucleotide pyrophosphorylase (carboxylating)